MNNQLIKKVIESNNGSCPPFVYKNPLLDKTVAEALSKSFVKLLSLSNQNSNINNNLRLSILENIRKLCQVQPEQHLQVDDTFTELLTKFYQMQLQGPSNNPAEEADKQLDAYLVKKMKGININTTFESTANPEIIQALINLNNNGVYLDTLSRDIIYWNTSKYEYSNIITSLWRELIEEPQDDTKVAIINDISVKMKPEIEKQLLSHCQRVLHLDTSEEIDASTISVTPIFELCKSCVHSPDCFQICSGILNFIFIMTNFDKKIQLFIQSFIKKVKANAMTFSMLYPIHLSSTVVLLDIEINTMPPGLKEEYIRYTVKYLKEIREKSENDFILLLSHFPDWFDIYFSQNID